ncbi:cation-transporting P-type ATPase [Botryobacter ruber]|uniref:cation-transporting P-type ATPase n=1 Tax=Botryobacter ruber TaxID=2171629 RepID=UPI000E0CAD89
MPEKAYHIVGLTAEQVRQSRERYGPNRLDHKKEKQVSGSPQTGSLAYSAGRRFGQDGRGCSNGQENLR